MKNIFGEEYVRTPVSLKLSEKEPVAWIKRGKIVIGFMSTNGWNGKIKYCEWDTGEPIIIFFSSNFSISVKEMECLIVEFKKHLQTLK